MAAEISAQKDQKTSALFHAPEGAVLEERLREAQKLALLGQLAGGVAHDFNNILSATLMHLGLLLNDPLMNAVQRESLKVMEKEITRAASLTRQLSAFGRRSSGAKVEALDLNLVIGDVVKMLRRLLRENVIVAVVPSAEGAWIDGDMGLLEQLVVNLCLLCRDAMPHGGVLTLATKVLTNSDAESAPPKAEFICFSATSSESPVNDPGPRTARIPAMTSREAQWTLEMVEHIVGRHHGRLEVPIKGKTPSFRIYLPAVAKPEKSDVPVDEGEANVGGSETILLVEDEIILRRISTQCLRKLGYAVFDAGDGVEATRLWEKHHEKINLLFTDYLLPGTDTGLDLARRMTAEKLDLKVMISSGNGEDLEEILTAEGQTAVRMSKPYTTASLAKVVRKCLDSGA